MYLENNFFCLCFAVFVSIKQQLYLWNVFFLRCLYWRNVIFFMSTFHKILHVFTKFGVFLSCLYWRNFIFFTTLLFTNFFFFFYVNLFTKFHLLTSTLFTKFQLKTWAVGSTRGSAQRMFSDTTRFRLKRFRREALVLVHEDLALGVSKFQGTRVFTRFRKRNRSAALTHWNIPKPVCKNASRSECVQSGLQLSHQSDLRKLCRAGYTEQRDYRVISWLVKVLDWTTATLQHSFWIMEQPPPLQPTIKNADLQLLFHYRLVSSSFSPSNHHVFWQWPSKHKGVTVHVHHSQRRPSTKSQPEEVQDAKEQTSRLTGMTK